MNKTIVKKYGVHVVWCVVAILAFVGGMYYGGSGVSANTTASAGGAGGSARTGAYAGRAGGGFVSGTVSAKDASSITVQLPNGNSEVVFYSTSTSVIMPSPASMTDVATGSEVSIGGTANGDGSVTAQTIQLRPAAPAGGK